MAMAQDNRQQRNILSVSLLMSSMIPQGRVHFLFDRLLCSSAFLCGISPHFVRSGDIPVFIYSFVYESQVFVTWSLLGRERTLGMSVCVWWPLLDSCVVCWRIISTCFLAAISLQGKEKSSSLLTFLYCIERVVPAIIF